MQGLSDKHTKLGFLSLSIYDNYTTASKCNRADWEIAFFSINAPTKPQFLAINFYRTSGSRTAGLTCVVKGTSRSVTFCLPACSF